MAEMSVRMTLTLADTASPGLRAFMALLDQLGPKVTGLSNRLNTLEGNLTKVGGAARTGAQGLGAFDAAASRSEAAAGRFTTSVGGTTAALAGFESMLRTVAGVLGTFATTMAGFAASFTTASASVAGATANLAGANAQMGTLTTRVHSLTHSLQGLAEAWAAAQLFKAGKASVGEAAEFQQLEARVKALNLPPEQTDEIMSKSRAMSKQLRFVSVNEAVEARIAAISGLGHYDPKIVDATLPEALKVAAILKMRGDPSEMKDLVRNLYGIAEARGQTSDISGMVQTFNLVQQNAAATGMKLTTKDIEAGFRQLKYGTGAMISDEGMVNMLAFMNQLKASGHGGGGSGGQGVTQAGTALTQVAKWGLGGITNKETARLLVAMGIMDPDKIRADSDTTQVNVGSKALKNSDLATRDPMGWLQSMAPIFLAFIRNNPAMFYPEGKDVRDPRATDEALTRLMIMLTGGQGGVNVGNIMALSVLSGPSSRIQEEAKLTFGAKKTPEAFADVEKTYLMRQKEYQAAVHSLELAFGEKLLPTITAIVTALGEFVRLLNEVADANPTATTITGIALAIGAVALALSGLNRLFGIFSAFSALWASWTAPVAGLGAAFTGAAGAATGAGGIIAGVVAALNVVMRNIIPLAGALLVGWDIGSILKGLEVGGATVQAWVERFMNWLDARAANARTYWLELFGFITPTEAEARRRNTAAQESNVASSLGGKVIQPGDKVEGTKPIGGAGVVTLQSVINRAQEDFGVLNAPGGRAFSTYTPTEQEALKKMLAAEAAGKQMTINIPAALTSQETPEQRRRREIEEAAVGIETGKYDPTAKAQKHVYNEMAGAAHQEYRLAASEMQTSIRMLDAQFKATEIGVQDYFDTKQTKIIEGYAAQISALEAQLEALKYPLKGPIDQGAIDRVKADIEMKHNERVAAVNVLEDQRTVKQTEYEKAQQDVERQSEAIGGNRHRAELMRLRQITAARYKMFVANQDPEHAAMVQDAGTRAGAGIEFDEIYVKLKEQLDDYKSKEQEVTDSVKAGARTQLEAETDVYELRRQAGFQIDGVLSQLRRLADASGDPKLISLVTTLSTQAKGAIQSLSPEVLKIKDVLESGLTDFFNGFQNRTKGIKALFEDLFNSIMRGLNNIASKQLAETIGNKIFGGLAGTGATGFGGIAGALFGNRGGGGSEWTTTETGLNVLSSESGGGGFWDFLKGLLPSFATGIENVPRDMLAMIHQDERVLTPMENKQFKATGGHAPVTNHFYLQEPTSQRTQNQIAARAAESIHNARRNM